MTRYSTKVEFQTNSIHDLKNKQPTHTVWMILWETLLNRIREIAYGPEHAVEGV